MVKNFITEFFTNDGHRYSRNEAGEDIFYPWYYPGEAFLISQELKSRLILGDSLLLIALLTCLGIACYLHYLSLITLNMLGVTLGIVASVYCLLKIFLAVYFRKKCRLYLLPEQSRPRKVFIFAWGIILFPLEALRILWYENLADPMMLLLFLFLSISTIFIIYTFCLTLKTRGYVFEKIGFFGS